MSWDKNTIRRSDIDAVVDVLKDMGVDYKLSVITKVQGRGLNDSRWDEDTNYDLRRLEYGNAVYLEKIEQDADCDINDIISSHKFIRADEPKDWKAIIQTDKMGDHHI